MTVADESPKPATAREVVARLRDAPLDEARELVERYADDPRKQVQKAVTSTRHRIEKEDAERERVRKMYALERELGNGGLVVGVDEVGRGALAGPLMVGAVALPAEPVIWGINDSKQLSPARREELAAQIEEVALAIGIAQVEAAEIDRMGMATALRVAMSQAIAATGVEPDCVIIDGNPVHVHPKEICVVHGDAQVASVAAASIVAKVTRDALMVSLADDYPDYHLAESKGYGSAEHIAAIREFGLTPIHRATFCEGLKETPRLF